MNYYEHHLGDYDSATAHLSWLEDCAYRRLLCLYYRAEAALPRDVKQVCRLVRASAKPERDAVQQVLNEFFELHEDGWHNERCDEDIASFHDTEPDREAKRENAKERQRRTRQRRRVLFESLRGHDIVPAWDASTKQLEALLQRAESHENGTPVTPPVTPPVTEQVTPPVTPVTCDATATQTPYPSSIPIPIPNLKERGRDLARPEEPDPDAKPSAAGLACRAIKAAGIADVNPGHPGLLRLLDGGVTPAALAATATELVAKGKPKFLLLLATHEGRLRDAAAAGAVTTSSDPQAWRKTEFGIRSMAAQLGVESRPDETFETWDRRVLAAWRNAGEPQPRTAEIAA